ncbi:MAG TPA: TolC family protein [Saprospiraceae bacterium]|nr:TolC family protein [Saprospiraceae bacterium]
MIRLLLIIFITLPLSLLQSQSVLDRYVEEAINNNLSVKEKKLLEQRELYSLERAGKEAGPEVRLLTSYTLAAGGRTIELPVGDLLNDVYSSLENLTGQPFPQVENQSVDLLPNNFYDFRFRITQPILQPEIKYNKLIQQEEVNLAGLMTDQTTRDLVRDVKTAYLQWMRAHDAIEIIDQGAVLLTENKRITESLIRNGSGLPSALIRIEAEITNVEAQRQRVVNDMANAAAFFNFLLERPGESVIEVDSFPSVPQLPDSLNVATREELQQIKTTNQIQSLALTLEEKHFAPRLGVQVDLGSQDFIDDWGPYVLGGVQLEIPIWDNKKSSLKRQEWEASIASVDTRYQYTREAYETQLTAEIRSLESDLAIYNSYTASLNSNQRYYTETARRYKEGLSNYIELLDARTEITNTKLLQNLAKYQAWIRQVNIERISATANIQ